MRKTRRYGHKWLKEEEEFLIKNIGNWELVKEMTGRSIHAIQQRFYRLKREYYPQTPNQNEKSKNI